MGRARSGFTWWWGHLWGCWCWLVTVVTIGEVYAPEIAIMFILKHVEELRTIFCRKTWAGDSSGNLTSQHIPSTFKNPPQVGWFWAYEPPGVCPEWTPRMDTWDATKLYEWWTVPFISWLSNVNPTAKSPSLQAWEISQFLGNIWWPCETTGQQPSLKPLSTKSAYHH